MLISKVPLITQVHLQLHERLQITNTNDKGVTDMKTVKKLLSLLVTLITLCSVITIPASAASTTAFDILSSSNYAKAFTLSSSGKTIPYTSSNLSTRGTATYGASSSSYIDNSTDELYILDVGYTNGIYWAYVSYPASNRRVNAYIPLSAITSNNAGHTKTTSTGKFYCSLRENTSAKSSYYVAEGDTVYLIATASSKYQILYPISGGKWRLAWCSASDYQKFCGSAGTSTGSGNTSDTAGMTDVTAYFAGRTITLQSVQNGKYLCADSNISNTPAMCNRDSSSTWETFTVSSITSDGWVGFKAAVNGKYLSAVLNATDAPVRAAAGSLQSWECFRIYQKGSDFYIRAQANNKWLCVRVDKDGAPVQAYANAASTWERFTIRFSGQEQYISTAELISTATANGISAQSDACKALFSINSKYAGQLNSTDKKGTMVFMFEGIGSDSSASRRMNAMCVVVKNGDIVYLNRNCSTIPDYPFNPAKNEGTAMPTIKSGIYNFTTVNHRGKYAALNVTNASVVRFNSKTPFYDSTSSAINAHRRSSNDIAPSSGSWVNSAGCLLVGRSGTSSSDEYARFIQALGIVASGASGSSAYKYSVTGKIVIDRTYACRYLSSIGYSDAAIKAIG